MHEGYRQTKGTFQNAAFATHKKRGLLIKVKVSI